MLVYVISSTKIRISHPHENSNSRQTFFPVALVSKQDIKTLLREATLSVYQDRRMALNRSFNESIAHTEHSSGQFSHAFPVICIYMTEEEYDTLDKDENHAMAKKFSGLNKHIEPKGWAYYKLVRENKKELHEYDLYKQEDNQPECCRIS